MMHISWTRVWGAVLRHLYNFKHNWDRLTDAFYWPSLDIVIWGLAISALEKQGQTTFAQIAVILFAVILWYVVWRGQGEITINFLEELWSENLANFFGTPLTVLEWTLSLCILGLVKLIMTVVFTAFVAWILYSANLFQLGPVVVLFIGLLLLSGWAFGFFMAGLFLRAGTDIQTLAWAGSYILMPFSAVYYAFDTLPQWVQSIGVWLPTTYVFEAMRIVLFTGQVPWLMLVKSFGLNIVFLILALWFFYRSFLKAKEKGLAHLH